MSENNSIKAHGGILINRITKVDSTGLFSITINYFLKLNLPHSLTKKSILLLNN